MNRKSKIKAGLSFGIGMTIFFILQNLLTRTDHSAKAIFIAIASGLVTGALAGVLYAWLMGLIMKTRSQQGNSTKS